MQMERLVSFVVIKNLTMGTIEKDNLSLFQ